MLTDGKQMEGAGPTVEAWSRATFYFTPVDSRQLSFQTSEDGSLCCSGPHCHQQLFWSKGL